MNAEKIFKNVSELIADWVSTLNDAKPLILPMSLALGAIALALLGGLTDAIDRLPAEQAVSYIGQIMAFGQAAIFGLFGVGVSGCAAYTAKYRSRLAITATGILATIGMLFSISSIIYGVNAIVDGYRFLLDLALALPAPLK